MDNKVIIAIAAVAVLIVAGVGIGIAVSKNNGGGDGPQPDPTTYSFKVVNEAKSAGLTVLVDGNEVTSLNPKYADEITVKVDCGEKFHIFRYAIDYYIEDNSTHQCYKMDCIWDGGVKHWSPDVKDNVFTGKYSFETSTKNASFEIRKCADPRI